MRLAAADEAGSGGDATGRFLLDASGFGRILPRLLDLEYPRSDLPMRGAIFTHITDHIGTHLCIDREKTNGPQCQTDCIWFWLIPFADGRASLAWLPNRTF